MSVFYQFFFQAVIVGAFFGSLTGFIGVSAVKGLFKLIKIIIKKIKEIK